MKTRTNELKEDPIFCCGYQVKEKDVEREKQKDKEGVCQRKRDAERDKKERQKAKTESIKESL